MPTATAVTYFGLVWEIRANESNQMLWVEVGTKDQVCERTVGERSSVT